MENLIVFPVEVRWVLGKPRASQDHICCRILQHQKLGDFVVQASDMESDVGGAVPNLASAQQCSLNGDDI